MRNKIIAIVISLAAFGVITWLMLTGRADGFDETVRNAFYSIRCPWLTVVAKGFTAIGSWWGVTLICLALLIIKPTRLKAGVPVILAALSSQVVEKILKHIVQRPRPEIADRLIEQAGHSFPSGHAMTSMAVFLMLIYVVRTQVRAPFTKNILTVILAIPMICIGLSRIYLGVHYPTDVMAGWSLGVTMAMLCIIIGEEANNKRRRGRYY